MSTLVKVEWEVDIHHNHFRFFGELKFLPKKIHVPFDSIHELLLKAISQSFTKCSELGCMLYLNTIVEPIQFLLKTTSVQFLPFISPENRVQELIVTSAFSLTWISGRLTWLLLKMDSRVVSDLIQYYGHVR